MESVRMAERITLDVPAGEAFAFLADPSTARIIDPAIRDYRPNETPMRLGTRTFVRLQLWGLPLSATSVVTAWEPGRVMAFTSVSPRRPVRVDARHEFEPDSAVGSTCTYTWAIECTPTLPGAALVARALVRAFRANAQAQQRRFKAAVETRRLS
jgi:hypothetical protein